MPKRSGLRSRLLAASALLVALVTAAFLFTWTQRFETRRTLKEAWVPMGAPLSPDKPKILPPTPAVEVEVERSVATQALALVAESAGDGLITCYLPEGTMEGDVSGFQQAIREGNRLTARVPTAHGRSILKVHPAQDVDPNDPWSWRGAPPVALGTAWWSSAFAGEVGTCEIRPTEWVPVTGRVVFTGGHRRCSVNGCGASAEVAEDGTFEMEIKLGPPCRLELCGRNIGPWVTIDPAHLPSSLVLEEKPAPDGPNLFQARLEELTALQQMASPIESALHGDMSPAVRLALEEMLQEEEAARSQQLDLLEDVINRMEEAADLVE